MPDTKTKLSDVIVPSKFIPYMIERTATLSAFYDSGIVARSPEFDALANGTGKTFNMPFWTDIDDADQIMSDTTAVVLNKIDGSKQDIAAKQGRQTAYSANKLVALLADGDPLRAVAELFATYWARRRETQIISILKGVFASALMDDSINDVSTEDGDNATEENVLEGSNFIDSLQKLGDNAFKLTAIAMHSATEASLLKKDLIEFIPQSEGKPELKSFQGRRVIVDDSLPVRDGSSSGKVYTSYLFGDGALAEGNANLNTPLENGFGTESLELARDSKINDDIVINRQIFILHPRGVKWKGTPAGQFPTNTELEVGTNWERVFETKNVRLVQIDHNNF